MQGHWQQMNVLTDNGQKECDADIDNEKGVFACYLGFL